MSEHDTHDIDQANTHGIHDGEEDRGVIEPLEPRSRRAGGPVARRIASTGNAEIDELVREIVDRLEGPNLDLVQETIVTAVRLALQGADRAELKMISASLKEFAYSFRIFQPYRHLRKVSIF